MEISAEWILASFVALAGIIATLARTIHNALSIQIKHQDGVINRLQDDVDRLSSGCGIPKCLWATRENSMSGNIYMIDQKMHEEDDIPRNSN